ncbi:noroxomaritidine synthase 2-like [Oryza brachyantha]|uniref:noroxomaritidine synthase 2-like n=1 Tax=Oryza brachyantha TaxID=4533 RepID=UPI001AD9E329|nr:noroxomaritidine synthase 2-like [Oryza brachyantha]
MALTPFLQQLLIISSLMIMSLFFYLCITYCRSKNHLIPMDWPILGMLPSLVANLHSLHDYLTAVLAASGQSFVANGPAATGMRFFITCDAANVRHIFSSNHGNYPKGSELGEIFDVVAGSIFTVDGEPALRQRAKFKSILANPRMVAGMASCCLGKVRGGLLPFLARKATAGTPFDMQGLIARFVFDVTAMPVFGVDPGLLRPDGMPDMHVSAAMDTVMEVALFRHIVPISCWKTMRRHSIGPERNLAAAHAVLHRFIAEMLEARKAKETHGGDAGEQQDDQEAVPDMLSSLINYPDYNNADLLRAALINYMIAGRDTIGTTLPWFFYNVAVNPHVVSGIREELAPIVASGKASPANGDDTTVTFSAEDTKPLVYLQAALLESLRLYPPGPIERKTVLTSDTMPSGDEVRAGDTVLVSLYSMGRMESLWGKDCREYRPERWLSDDDGGRKKQLRYVPSHKFLAFNSGPRMCLGRDIAVAQMKTVAAAVVWNFDVEVVEGQAVEPKLSCLLQMKNGLMVKVKKRVT